MKGTRDCLKNKRIFTSRYFRLVRRDFAGAAELLLSQIVRIQRASDRVSSKILLAKCFYAMGQHHVALTRVREVLALESTHREALFVQSRREPHGFP
jgi:hypothetical protein